MAESGHGDYDRAFELSPGERLQVRVKRKPRAGDFSSLQYRVTPFKASGIYPRGVFCSRAAAFFADDEAVFAVTHCSTWRSKEDLPYSEVDWMNPELVRLLGSLMLCERFTDRRCWFYPHVHADLLLANKHLDLADAQCVAEIKLVLAGEPLFTSPSPIKSLPEGYLSHGYLFEARELNIEMRDRYWQRISTSNLLLMRGIQALVKCDMLAMHPEFQEEAAIASFIALDA